MGIGRSEKPLFVEIETGAIVHLDRLKGASCAALRPIKREKPAIVHLRRYRFTARRKKKSCRASSRNGQASSAS
jgi:hypothetical protein